MSEALKIMACRLPQTLIDQAQRHADLYRTSLSQLLREGLEYRLSCKTWPPRPQTTLHNVPTHIHTLLADLTTHLTHVQEELWALPGNDVVPSTSPTAQESTATDEHGLSYNGITEEENTLTYNRHTEHDDTVFPEDTNPYNSNTKEDGASSYNGIITSLKDNQKDTGQLGYDRSKFTLGTACKRGHLWSNTGMTLRELKNGKVGECVECHRERARASVARQRKQRL
jgi:hypothetical protein